MAAGKYDITIEQGATFRMKLRWKDSEGEAVDFTGYAARMQIRQFVQSDEVLLSLNTGNGGISFDNDGFINVLATAEQTEEIADLAGVYDLEMVSADNTVTRLIEGKVRISPEVTR
jgi:hypothetical protein